MKKLLLTTLFILCSALAFCEIPNVYPYNNNAEYQLYPTTNMWTFLKLDTSKGMIWIVQYSVDDFKDSIINYKSKLCRLPYNIRCKSRKIYIISNTKYVHVHYVRPA